MGSCEFVGQRAKKTKTEQIDSCYFAYEWDGVKLFCNSLKTPYSVGSLAEKKNKKKFELLRDLWRWWRFERKMNGARVRPKRQMRPCDCN